ncbi:hypothetical protein CHS0354_007252 [Potamilus streckersoni]|uniref:Uncharacterized protein n=1 Tax=Potamilus streckersoni TaxID=2493646 RepID=A0AAE0WBL9_9BIVA|nr:hypothetical protein CHS0354_007252 [Potamilus streckersoni]
MFHLRSGRLNTNRMIAPPPPPNQDKYLDSLSTTLDPERSVEYHLSKVTVEYQHSKIKRKECFTVLCEYQRTERSTRKESFKVAVDYALMPIQVCFKVAAE